MYAMQPVGLVQIFFDNPDYLVAHGGVSLTFLFYDTINYMRLPVYCYIKFFSVRVGYTPLGTHVTASWQL